MPNMTWFYPMGEYWNNKKKKNLKVEIIEISDAY